MTNHVVDLERTFRALCDPTRRAVLPGLAARRASVTDLFATFAMARPRMLQHGRGPEAGGLMISSKKDGRSRIRWLRREAFEPVAGWPDQQRPLRDGRTDRFDVFIIALQDEEIRHESR